MAKPCPHSPAGLVLEALSPDTLYQPIQAQTRLRAQGCPRPEQAIQQALAQGWLVEEETGEISYPGRCWRPVRARDHLPSICFSYFLGPIGNVYPQGELTPTDLFQILTQDQGLREHTAALRQARPGSAERDAHKRRLAYVTPAGTFAPTRRIAHLQKRSGLMVLDFDHVPDPATARAALLADSKLAPTLVLLFVSPSGQGLKAFLRVDPQSPYERNFFHVSRYLKAHYESVGLICDPSGKDLARACFVCHDPAAYLHPSFHS